MGSYLLVLLLVHLIQNRNKKTKDEESAPTKHHTQPEEKSTEDELLGRLFVDFFFEVGVNLDYSLGISVLGSGATFEKARRYSASGLD